MNPYPSNSYPIVPLEVIINESKKTSSRPDSEQRPVGQALPIKSPIFEPEAPKSRQSQGSSALRKSQQRNSELALLGSGRGEFGPDVLTLFGDFSVDSR